MKARRTNLGRRYLAALRAQLLGKTAPAHPRAQTIGRSALAEGLATLDLAVVHQQAMRVLAAAPNFVASPRSIKVAGAFFEQALIPLENERRALREANGNLLERNATLRRHADALAQSNRRLEREIRRRKAGEGKIQQAKVRYYRLFLESQVMQDKLRQLTRQIISAQEEERKQISRELHDHVVQTLIGINVELATLGLGVAEGARKLRRKIIRTQRLVAQSVNAVHQFARELRPAVLDDLGLIPALQAFGQNLAARKKLRIKMTAFSGVETLSIAKRTVLFRVAQEALNNVGRHANATDVALGITKIPNGIRMEVCDNGKSFPVVQTLLAKNNKRLGLVGMRERIEMIGGRLSIQSSPGRGTIVRTEIPV